MYRPQSVEEIQTALKKIFAPIFEAALKGELKIILDIPRTAQILRNPVTPVMAIL